MNREEWLNACMLALAPLLEENVKGATATMDTWRVSVGFPGGRGKKNKAIGQCWSDTCSKGGRTEMFVSPVLDDGLTVAATLLHEMVHASVGVKFGHSGPFAKLARAVGLAGKLTATVPGPELKERLNSILATLGDYPHAGLNASEGRMETPKQTTRMLKACCPDCGYTIRLTAIWVARGLPICPGCDTVFILDGSK